MQTRYLIQLMDPGETWEAWLASIACITPPHHSFLWAPGSKTLDRQTGKQFIIKLFSEDNRRRGVTITFLNGCSNEADHSAAGWGKIIPTPNKMWFKMLETMATPAPSHSLRYKIQKYKIQKLNLRPLAAFFPLWEREAIHCIRTE